MKVLEDLLSQSQAVGHVQWLGVASASRAPIEVRDTVSLIAEEGIDGDHHRRPGNRKRQVTLIQAEHIDAVVSLLGREDLSPELLRRNIVVDGVNLQALRYQKFRIGDAILEGSGPCPPCSRMEENLGMGGYAAMMGHGGITARVVQGGAIRTGDQVAAIPPA